MNVLGLISQLIGIETLRLTDFNEVFLVLVKIMKKLKPHAGLTSMNSNWWVELKIYFLYGLKQEIF